MVDAGGGLQRLFHAFGAVLEHRQAGKTVADDNFPLRRGAAKLVDDRFAENPAALSGLLPYVGGLHRRAQQIELHDRNAARNDVVEAVRHRIARNRGCDSLRSGIDDILHELQLTVRRGPLLLRDFERDFKIIGGSLRPIDDLLDERVALGMGDEPDRYLILGLGGRSQKPEPKSKSHTRHMPAHQHKHFLRPLCIQYSPASI